MNDSLIGAILADGKVYRVLGKDDIRMKTLGSMFNEENWERKYTTKTPKKNGR